MPRQNYPGWPYAAKAVIQYNFDGVDTFYYWLTFPDAMDMTVKPADGKFVATDGIDIYYSAHAAWSDAHTLTFSTPAEGYPADLLIKYDGPSPNLRTAQGKQWEPWGYILGLDITT